MSHLTRSVALSLFAVLSSARLAMAEPPTKTLAKPEGEAPVRGPCDCDRLTGFGGPLAGITSVAGGTGFIIGGEGGAVLKHRFVLGAAGAVLVNKINMPASANLGPGTHDVGFGYGGFWFSYIIGPDWIIHPSVGVLIGGGSISYQIADKAPGMPATHAMSTFFQASPEIDADINVTRFLRIDLGVFYRIVPSVDLEDVLKASDVSGPGAQLAIKFGAY
jgi:hypothetical protein